MGETFVKAKLCNQMTKQEKEIKFLVDTGATISVIPKDILKALRVKPTDKEEFELANGKTKQFLLGELIIKLDGKTGSFKIAFGPEKSQPLLGLVVLETFGYRVDPIARKLVKRRLFMYRIGIEKYSKNPEQ